uniref:Uncharacterized protein n=1 Tax=Rhodosorus marinus TaxID=101924 RepID=A0A7S0BDD0_9RHOD|mmetsp:Transcript_11316/g.16393  ORF Transcript_11316/g.16393 Transcript_11316/m.16393 type:complete len:166 (+) Transcript_11316:59-556(+)
MRHPIVRGCFIDDRSTIRALHSYDSPTSVLLGQVVEPSQSLVFWILEKIGDALERGAKAVDGGTKAVGKVFSFLPPLSIGIGFGTGCGVGLGWSFQQVRREGLISPPRYFAGCGAGIGVGLGVGQGFGRNLTRDNRPEYLQPKDPGQIEREIRAFFSNLLGVSKE